MNVVVLAQAASASIVIRDRRGEILGRIEDQGITQRRIARNARGEVVGVFDRRANLTRDARGHVVGTGDLLSALLLR
ncbi:hypothetical protein ACQVP2_34715 [Methylobacterium aquaticum]|uniref:hypothetical protein n=1 Tax=Methylobacterium aquaticum TaxID=270351 RepID=UPI003D17CDF1